MKKKNDIEKELDQKEFENELDRDLSDQYQKIGTREKFLEDKNPYVIGAINFFGTLFFTVGFYLAVKLLFLRFAMEFLANVYAILDPLVYGISLVLAIVAVIRKESPLDTLLNRFF